MQQQQLLLAVEVDGPQHFLYPAQQLNGERGCKGSTPLLF
jgi:hypothetical protein